MISNIRFKARIQDGKWVNSTRIMTSSGVELTVVMDRLYNSAQIYNKTTGALLAENTTPTSAADLAQAIKNALIGLGVIFAVDNTPRASNVTMEEPEPTLTQFTLSFSPSVGDYGSYAITDGTNTTDLISADGLASEVEDAVQTLPGLESVTVTGDAISGYTLSDVPSDITLTDANNTLRISAKYTLTFATPPTTGTILLAYGAFLELVDVTDANANVPTAILNLVPSAIISGNQTVGFTITLSGVIDPETLSLATDSSDGGAAVTEITAYTPVSVDISELL